MPTTEMTAIIPADVEAWLEEQMEAAKRIEGAIIPEIRSNDELVAAQLKFKEVSSLWNEIEKRRKEVKQPHLDAGKEIDRVFGRFLDTISTYKVKINHPVIAYTKKIEEERRREQERLDREAEKKRREAEERARIQREKEEAARREEEEARRRAQEAANAEERQKALVEAERKRKEAEAAAERARAQEDKSERIVAPIAQAVQTQVSGTTIRETWKGEVTDPMAFVKYAIENNQWSWLQPNESAFNNYAKSIRKEMTFPGGRIYAERKLSGSR